MRKGITITAVTVFTVLSLTEAASAYYSPAKGRFLARDPIGEEGGANLHGFVGNGPTNSADPDGRRIVTISGFGQAAATMDPVGEAMKKAIEDKFKEHGQTLAERIVPFGGGGVGPEQDMIKEFKDWAASKKRDPCSIEQFLAVGHSDGATALYHFLRANEYEVVYASPARAYVPTYVGLIDLVRREYVVVGNGAPNIHKDNFITDIPPTPYLMLVEPFYQEIDVWKGYHFEGFVDTKVDAYHLTIVKNEGMIRKIAKSAADAYYSKYLMEKQAGWVP